MPPGPVTKRRDRHRGAGHGAAPLVEPRDVGRYPGGGGARSHTVGGLTTNRQYSFGVRVHATGRKVYVVQSRGPGGPRRVTLGRHGEMSTEEARKHAALVIDRIKRGEDPTPAPPEAELTVAGLAERFMRVHVEAHLKPGSVAAYLSVLKKHVPPALGAMAVGEVGRRQVSALHHRLRDTPSLANMAVHLLSRMFTLAEAWDLAPAGRNPCRGLRRYRTRPRERFLTPEEYRRLGRPRSRRSGY